MAANVEHRLDPDELLVRVQEEERRAARGKLTIFFGAAPGVGKTYTMLEAARIELTDQKRDVVVGIVETHGRYDTGALLIGLELLPVLKIEHKGIALGEFDIDGALKRRPDLILIDELAHTNAPGSRHVKRWRDVEELLEAGINVFTTLNVQHLESLNDVVAQITGVVVRETVPDSVFDTATEVRAVDLPVAELLERLREGKVYVPRQVERALQNFFKEGNLIALRELALRRTAERVDAQMRGYKVAQGIEKTWHTGERLLVCISPSPHSERLLRAARRMATSVHGELLAVYVETPAALRLAAADRERLAAHMRLAEELGAEPVTIRGEKAAEETVRFARKRNATKIVVGKPTHPRWRDLIAQPFLDELVRRSGDIDVFVVSGLEAAGTSPRLTTPPSAGAPSDVHAQVSTTPPSADVHAQVSTTPPSADVHAQVSTTPPSAGVPSASPERGRNGALGAIPRDDGHSTHKRSLKGYFAAVFAVVASAVVAGTSFGRTQLTDIVMIFLLGIVVVSMRFGYGPALLAAVAGVVTFDFFFVPPYYSLAVSDFRHVVTFVVMFLVAGILSHLTTRIRDQADAARHRERRTASLYAISRELAAAQTLEVLLATGARHVHDTFDAAVAVFLPTEGGPLRLEYTEPGSLREDEGLGLAEWVWMHERPAGVGTDTLPTGRALFAPLKGARGRVGVLALVPKGDLMRLRDPEDRQLLGTFAGIIGSAIERAQLAEEARRGRLRIETEQLRNSLLSSVSHDLRTPLAVVTGAAETLLGDSAPKDPGVRRELLETIHEEGQRLNRLVRNLLDMTRLDAGAVRVNKELQPIEEVIGAALNRTEDRLDGRAVNTHVPRHLPLVPLDTVLIEQVLINLIENAIRYSAARTPIDIGAFAQDGSIQVEVADRGPGVAPQDAERIFEKFYRAREGGGGVGLGLTICRGIVRAHGGRVWVETRPGGGASFRFTLPLDQALVDGGEAVVAGEDA